MKLTALHLENIRSYDSLDIDFKDGTTLFEGDIGCGKSTLLMAIEFALFGLGNMKGNSLLRTGEQEGIVRLNFAVDGKEYEVQRKLKRSKSKTSKQSSSECYIKTKEGKLPLSPSELKTKILEVLNFNEPPDPRAKSVIFTYAVFTPQEEMKSILFDDPERRLQTLRKAFRIEDYKIAVENAGNIITELNSKASELKGAAKGVEEDLSKKQFLEAEVKSEQEKITPLESKKRIEANARQKIQDELKDSRKQQTELSKTVGQIPVITKRISDSKTRIEDLKVKISNDEEKIGNIGPKKDDFEKFKKPTDKAEDIISSEIEDLVKLEKNLRKSEGALESKIKEYETVKDKGLCPTCDRPASPDEFTGKISEADQKRKDASKQVEEICAKIQEKRDLVKSLQEYNRAQEKIKDLKIQLDELHGSVAKDRQTVGQLEAQILQDTAVVEKAQKDYSTLKKLEIKIGELEKDDKEKERLINSLQTSITTIEEKIRGIQRSITDYEQIIKNKLANKKQFEKLSEYVIWLRDYFAPTLQSIETTVMASIKEEFNEKFRQWFAILVEDTTKDAEIDEEFTPIVRQDGYDQEIQYLSGGEKTSVALAYRLSLNCLVQKVSTGIKSNLLILDEPTDGFSREQLFKVRDILYELKCPQVILVSHEKELESFADNICKIVKTNGISKIVQ